MSARSRRRKTQVRLVRLEKVAEVPVRALIIAAPDEIEQVRKELLDLARGRGAHFGPGQPYGVRIDEKFSILDDINVDEVQLTGVIWKVKLLRNSHIQSPWCDGRR